MTYVFETFRNESINSLELDAAYYLLLVIVAMQYQRFTDFNLKLISDIKKYQFIENTIMSAISLI